MNDQLNFFFYGTLMSNSGRDHWMRHLMAPVGPAQMHGRMYDVGAFPAVVDDAESIVSGELWQAHDADCLAPLLERLDMIEGYVPKRPQNSMFLREQRELLAPFSGTTVWTYIWNNSLHGWRGPLPHVWHGDWRRWKAAMHSR